MDSENSETQFHTCLRIEDLFFFYLYKYLHDEQPQLKW